jgi:hypothetical protein
MHVFEVANVNEALSQALTDLYASGVETPSRNGSVIRFPGPVAIVYRQPLERVLFSPVRNAHPFFHFFESLWMLAGRNDVAFVSQFVKRMATFSDDGETFHGAYGYRWRHWFAADQIKQVVQELKANPTSRRCVIAMWAGEACIDNGNDLDTATAGGKDVPCNTHIYFEIADGALNMAVCNRSNDLIWGACGANAVHMSYLQEYTANTLGVPVGKYTQFSNNMHVYTDQYPAESWAALIADVDDHDMYKWARYKHAPLISDAEREAGDGDLFDRDLRTFFDYWDRLNNASSSSATGVPPYHSEFFRTVAIPMWNAWLGRDGSAADWSYRIGRIAALDWRLAVAQWNGKRQLAKIDKAKAKLDAAG